MARGNYLLNTITAPVTQKERLTKNQVKNNAGGFVYKVDPFTRLTRFLILGSEGATYYVSEKDMVKQNIACIDECIASDYMKTIDLIVDVSDKGRAPKNDTALLALAKVAASKDVNVRRAAFNALPQVARIPTHLFDFVSYLDAIRGTSGRAFRTAMNNWYNSKSVESVAYTMAKYRQRNGWENRDLLRLGHVAPLTNGAKDEVRETIYKWAIDGGWETIGDGVPDNNALATLWAYEKAKRAKNAREIVPLIRDFNLSREMIPTEFLKSKEVWDALLHAGKGMPIEAMIRNLGVMTSIGLIAPLSEASAFVRDRITNEEVLRKGRVHPIKLLAALMTYKQGHGTRGSNTWNVVPSIVNALDAGFYKAFGNVPSTGKNHLLALDTSGSMGGGVVGGIQGLTPRIASAAMALVTMNAEPNTLVIGFTGNGSYYASRSSQPDLNGVSILDISPKMRLDDVVNKIARLPYGPTDCALPFVWAQHTKMDVEAFVVYTDSETWYGAIHPSKALEQYRVKMDMDAKSVVVGMTATEFTIANPDDTGMLDVVGFDTSAPSIISEFVAGNI